MSIIEVQAFSLTLEKNKRFLAQRSPAHRMTKPLLEKSVAP
jgi:hypothetical protein